MEEYEKILSRINEHDIENGELLETAATRQANGKQLVKYSDFKIALEISGLSVEDKEFATIMKFNDEGETGEILIHDLIQ